MFAEEKFEVFLFEPRDFVERRPKSFAEDVLPRFARDELKPVAPQRKNGAGRTARRIFERLHPHRHLVGLDAGEIVVRHGMGDRALLRNLGNLLRKQIFRRQQGHRRTAEGPCHLVGHRSTHTQIFLRKTRIGARKDPVALGHHVDRQRGAGVGDGRALRAFGSAEQRDIRILRRGTERAEQQGKSHCQAFHSRQFFKTYLQIKYSQFSQEFKI